MKAKVLGLAAAMSIAAGLTADNNIVSTLQLNKNSSDSSFTLHKTGWVRVEGQLPDTVTFQGSGKADVTVASRFNRSAVALLEAGTYTVKSDLASARRIGQNMYCSMDGNFNTDEPVMITVNPRKTGRSGMFLYNWNYLYKNILDPFNVVLLNSTNNPEIKQWRQQGRKIIRRSTILPKTEDTLALWDKVSSEEGIDGIIPDEFVIPAGRKNASDASLGYNNPGMGFNRENLDNITVWAKNHPDMRFWAWLGIPWNALNEDLKPLIDVLNPAGGYVAWESYAFGRKYEQELKSRYLNRASGFKNLPGGMGNFVVCPATFEFIDNNWEVDFKVWLDMQLNAVATHPDFKGTAGIGMWIAYYTDPEILRWYSALVKHYAVDGNTEMLSKQYGFTIQPGLVKSANWENLDPWQISGNAKLVAVKDSKLTLTPYSPKSTANMLLVSGSKDKGVTATQQITGLTPGKVYSLEAIVVDPAQDGSEVWYPFTAQMSGVETLDTTVRQYHDFMIRKQVFNIYKVRFRADSTGAAIVLKYTPGTDAELLVDSVRITPYFE